MFVIIYILTLGIVTQIISKKNNVEGTSEEMLQWSNQDKIILISLFGISIVLQVLAAYIELNIIFYLIYLFICIFAIFYVNKHREEWILEYQKQVDQIIDSLEKLIKVDKEDINYSELPFIINKTGSGKINKIVVDIKEPNKFKDATLIQVVYSLNNFFPYFDWDYSVDFQEQKLTLTGNKLPPDIAPWKGSDYRPPEFLALGLSGSGEVGLNIGVKDWGESEYIFEDGERAGTVKLPSSPQILTLGSTGGGKSVTLRDIILHSLTHSDDIVWGGIDLKLSEFERYKSVKGCVGIANTIKEAAELLRMAREVMQKRNKFNAEHNLVDFADYKPSKPTDIIRIFGREFQEDTQFEVMINGEEKQMTAKEFLEWYKKE